MTDTLLTPWLLTTSLTILSASPSQARHQTLLYPINHSNRLLQLTSLIKDPGGAYVGWCSDKIHVIMTVFTNDSVRKKSGDEVNNKQVNNGNFELGTKKGIVFRINRWRFARAPVNGIETLMLVVDEWSEVGVPPGLEIIGTPSHLNEVTAIKDTLKKQKKENTVEETGTQQPMTQAVTQHSQESPNKALSGQLKDQVEVRDWKIPTKQEELLAKIQLPCTPEHVQMVVDHMSKEKRDTSLPAGGLVKMVPSEAMKDKSDGHPVEDLSILDITSTTQKKALVKGQVSPSKPPSKSVPLGIEPRNTVEVIVDTARHPAKEAGDLIGITPNKQQAISNAATRSAHVQILPKSLPQHNEVIIIEARNGKPVAVNPVVRIEKTTTPQGMRLQEARMTGTPSKAISEAFPEHALNSLELLIQAEAKKRRLEQPVKVTKRARRIK